MPTYPRATWVRPLWWVNGRDQDCSRPLLIKQWVARAEPPKPPKPLFGIEMTSWSGQLGATGWVAEAYTATAAYLAGVNEAKNAPESWLRVSELYADCADPLARFSAGFAAAAHEQRPRRMPSGLDGTVREFARRVPKVVREAMVATGGVLGSAADVTAFVAEPDRHRATYHPVAMRKYRDELVAKEPDFADDPDAAEVVRASIEALEVAYGAAPAAPPAHDQSNVIRVLEQQFSTDPKLRHKREYWGIAYERALKTLTKMEKAGTPIENAVIVHRMISGFEKDGMRKARRWREVPLEPDLLGAAPEVEPGLELRAAAVAVAVAERYRAPGAQSDWWERRITLEILGDTTFDGPTRRDLDARVRADWKADLAPGARRPNAAVTGTPRAAVALVRALLVVAVGSLPARPDAAVTEARERAIELIAAHHIVLDDEERDR
ncbi:hypothetical protein [Nocardia sp. NPDC057227]|uniref:hypothetical protein n=1 Tax=Nocardia sp. NPDC057227 TaxID=3346056 RepID=UPI0036306B48